MSTPTPTAAPARGFSGSLPGSRARFTDLLASEWLKLRSLRSTPWSLLAGGLAVAAFNVGGAYDTYSYWYQHDAASRAEFVAGGMPLAHAFSANASMLLMLVAAAFGALTVTGEYSTGQIRTTFAAVPARRSLMAAKVTIVAAVTAVFGAVVAGASFWITQAILSARDAGVALDHPGALRLVTASALLAPLSALVGMALASLLRHPAGTTAAAVAILMLLPMAVGEDRRWSALLSHALSYDAWLRLAENTGRPEAAFPWSAAGAWTVYALWALAAAAITVTAVHRRDQ